MSEILLVISRQKLKLILHRIWIESHYSFNKGEAEKLFDRFRITTKIKENETKTKILMNLLKFLSEKYNISIIDLKSKRRFREFVKVRQIYCYLAREKYTSSSISLKMIGAEINIGHSAVLHSIRTIEQDMKRDKYLQQAVEDYMKQ